MIVKIKMREPRNSIPISEYLGAEPKLFPGHNPKEHQIGQIVEIEKICGDIIFTIQIFPEKIKEVTKMLGG